MFLSKSLGFATLNPRQLLILSFIFSVCVQGGNGKTSACKNTGLNSTAVCESETIVSAADDGKGNSNTTDIDENDVTINDLNGRDSISGNCASVGVIFARGTTEPGNVGILAGPSFFDALDDKIEGNEISIQGVNYLASTPEFLIGGSPAGAAEMARLITESREKCPDTHLIVSGYSQGSQLVHAATDQLPADVTNGIGAIVMFGDPLKGTPIKNYNAKKVLTVCHDEDKICDGKPIVLPSHLTYSRDADAAAEFSINTLARKGIRGYDHTYCKHCGDYHHHYKPWHKYRPYHRHPYFYWHHRPYRYHGYDDASSTNATESANDMQPNPEDSSVNDMQPNPEDSSVDDKNSPVKPSTPASGLDTSSLEPASPGRAPIRLTKKRNMD